MGRKERVYLYDTMLRDGAQTRDITMTVVDKQDIAKDLDSLGIDYIEGGWPGANPTDDKFFAALPKLKQSRMVAFGSTRKKGTSAANDPGLNALVNSGAKAVCIVGKASARQVKVALGVSQKENLEMVAESIAYLKKKGVEPMFDAEHFFDGYKENPEYTLEVVKAAYDNGARWVVLCDTNGGVLPHEVSAIVAEVTKYVPGKNLGIHCHNDAESAVANSLAAVMEGVRQVQGTLNGYGERCGNTNLVAIIPTLKIKLKYDIGISDRQMKKLTKISHALDDKFNRAHYRHAAYVGSSAFAHKGGLHASAVMKDPSLYEHIKPEMVGNERNILISDQAGRSNIINRVKSHGIRLDTKDSKVKGKIDALVEEVKRRENMGYAYDTADASFEILAKSFLGKIPEYYSLKSFRVIDERRWNAKGELVTLSEATVKLMLDDNEVMTVAEGNGPVNALSNALKKALARKYKSLKDIKLRDYKVRIITPEQGTRAITRVSIETSDAKGNRWTTIGVSANIIDASYNALHDSMVYRLLKS